MAGEWADQPGVVIVSQGTARRQLLASLLGDEYATCCVAFDDDPGCASRGPAVELVLLDLGGGSTLEASLEALRGSHDLDRGQVPVVVLGEDYDAGIEAAALAAGASDYLANSVHPRTLKQRLRIQIQAHRYRRSLSGDAGASHTQGSMFAAFMQHAPGIMTVRDLEGRYLMASTSLGKRTGRPVADILGRTNEELQRFSAATLEAVATHEGDVIRSLEPRTERRWETHGDGARSERLVTKFPVFDARGALHSIGTIDVDVTAFGEAERALAERNSNFQTLVQGSIQGIVIHRDMRPLFVNQSFAEMHGYASAEELLTLASLRVTIAQHDRERVVAISAQRSAGGPAPDRYEYDAVRKDGKVITVQAAVSPTRWHGEAATQVAVIETTEQRRVVDALRASEAQMTAFFDNSPHPMVIQDADGRYVKENAANERFMGAKYGFAESRPEELWPSDTAATLLAAYSEVVETRQPVRLEMDIPVRTGISPMLVTKFPILDADDELLGLGTIGTDFSVRKAMEAELRDSRSRLRDFAEASSDWFWETGPDLGLRQVSERGTGPLGEVAALWMQGNAPAQQPAARDAPLQARWQLLWSELRAQRQVRNLELPFRTASGATGYVRISGRPLRDAAGVFAGYRGVGSDVTDVVNSRLQAELLRDAIDRSSDATVLYDHQLRTVFTNRRYHELFTMLPPQDAIANMSRADQFRAIVAGGAFAEEVEADQLEAYVDSLLAQSTAAEETSRERHFAGGRTYVERPFAARDGGLLLQLQDVTERKAAELQVRAHQDELRRLATELSITEERERRRIATELHDGAVQNLGLARIKLGSAGRTVAGTPAETAVSQSQELLSQAIRELRTLMSDLSPPMLYDLGLGAAVRWLAERFREQHELDCTVSIDSSLGQLPGELSVLLFQCIRELLLNVIKHAKASHCGVAIGRTNDRLEIVVSDDGIGLSERSATPRPTEDGGFGLFNVRERLAHMGGSMHIESNPGTRITLRIHTTGVGPRAVAATD